MLKRGEHKQRTFDALVSYQAALDTGRVYVSPHNPKKVAAKSDYDQKYRAPEIVYISFADILKEAGYFVPVEINPAYALAGRIGHRLIVSRLADFFPERLDEERTVANLMEDPELASLDQSSTQMWMFSEAHPQSQKLAHQIFGVIQNFESLDRLVNMFEKTVIIPAGEFHRNKLVISTRADVVSTLQNGQTAVDNFKTGRQESYKDSRRVRLDMFMLEITAAAIANGVESTRVVWRNGEKVQIPTIESRLPIDRLVCRLIPPGRIVCSDGVIGQETMFANGGIKENERLRQIVDGCVAKRLSVR